jgi:hypothetical protein
MCLIVSVLGCFTCLFCLLAASRIICSAAGLFFFDNIILLVVAGIYGNYGLLVYHKPLWVVSISTHCIQL